MNRNMKIALGIAAGIGAVYLFSQMTTPAVANPGLPLLPPPDPNGSNSNTDGNNNWGYGTDHWGQGGDLVTNDFMATSPNFNYGGAGNGTSYTSVTAVPQVGGDPIYDPGLNAAGKLNTGGPLTTTSTPSTVGPLTTSVPTGGPLTSQTTVPNIPVSLPLPLSLSIFNPDPVGIQLPDVTGPPIFTDPVGPLETSPPAWLPYIWNSDTGEIVSYNTPPDSTASTSVIPFSAPGGQTIVPASVVGDTSIVATPSGSYNDLTHTPPVTYTAGPSNVDTYHPHPALTPNLFYPDTVTTPFPTAATSSPATPIPTVTTQTPFSTEPVGIQQPDVSSPYLIDGDTGQIILINQPTPAPTPTPVVTTPVIVGSTTRPGVIRSAA